jgi:hypothetical protein
MPGRMGKYLKGKIKHVVGRRAKRGRREEYRKAMKEKREKYQLLKQKKKETKEKVAARKG